MSKLGVQAYVYLGVVKEVLGETDEEKQEYRILADIPGVIEGVNAYPRRDNLDEPRPGDPIILFSLDPDFNSYYLYWKLKEDDFTGFRSAGKEIYMTPDEIVARVYQDGEYEKGEHEPGEEIASVRINKEGEITTTNKTGTKITVDDQGSITVSAAPGQNINVHLEAGTLSLTGMENKLDLGVLVGKLSPLTGFVDSLVWGKEGTPIPFITDPTFMG